MAILFTEGFERYEADEDYMESVGDAEFDCWRENLHAELQYLVQLPMTEDNVQKIGELVTHAFSAPFFRHDDHEVHVHYTKDGGLGISIVMTYADPNTYSEDFGLPPDEDFHLLILSEEGEELMNALENEIDRDFEFVLDIPWNPDPAMIRKAEEAYRASLMDQQLREQRSRITEVMHDRVLSMYDGPDEAETEQPKTTESVDDALFAPIKKEEPAPVYSPHDYCCDMG